MSEPDNARRPADQAGEAPQPGQWSRRYSELRDFPATDQAIRQEVRPTRACAAATDPSAALSLVAGKPASEWREGSDGR